MDYLLGIDLGGTSIKIGCFDTSLTLIGKAAEATSADMDAATMVGCFRRLAESLLSEHGLGLDDLSAVGIGTPGPIDLNEGIVLAAPNLPLFRNVPLRALVTEALGKKTIMENDANAACWAEYVAGAGQGADEMVMLTLGTGIGGGIITRGRLVHGVAGGAAELGHIILYPEGRLCACGQKGCAEAYASARSTAKRATEAIAEGKTSSMTDILKANGELTCKDVFDHAAMQDALAKEVIDGTARALALVCTQLANIVSPKYIVLAGGMIDAGDALLLPVRSYFMEYASHMSNKENMEIRLASLGTDAGMIGAAALARTLLD